MSDSDVCLWRGCADDAIIDGYCRPHWRRWKRWDPDSVVSPTTNQSAPGLSSTDVVLLVPGLTYRMLDYWIRIGAIAPSMNDAVGSGSHRRFSEHDVAVLKRAVEMKARHAAELEEFTSGRLWRSMRPEAVSS